MQKPGYLLVLFVFMLIFGNGDAQTTKAILNNGRQFYVDTTITQNKSIFKFWRAAEDTAAENSDEGDTLRKRLVIERITKTNETIIFNDDIRDGDYLIGDENYDGYIDLITFYHDYNRIHFFDAAKNKFDDEAIQMPPSEIIDKRRKIFYGSHESMYGNRFAYSVLFRYNGKTPYFYYKLLLVADVAKTDEDSYENIDRQDATRVELYRCKNGVYNNLVLVKRIQLKKKGVFDERNYWRVNYKTLLHLQ